MRVKSLKFKVKGYFKSLFAVHCSLFTDKSSLRSNSAINFYNPTLAKIPPRPPLVKGGWGDFRGFTLIEIIMIIVVVAIAIPALLIILGQEAKQSVNAELQVSATNIAQALMEEIKTKRWDENATPPPYTTPLALELNECRTSCTGLQCGANPIYDDVDDYNGYSETCSWGGVSYDTNVSVCYVAAADLNTCLSALTTSDFKRIIVTVSNATLGSVELVTVVTNY